MSVTDRASAVVWIAILPLMFRTIIISKIKDDDDDGNDYNAEYHKIQDPPWGRVL